MAKRRTAAQKAATRRMIAANRARKGSTRRKARRAVTVTARASNPAPRRRAARRRNPIAAYRKRRTARRTNPISMTGIMPLLKDAAIQGAGAVAMDMAFGYVNRYLPASLQRVPGSLGVGDVVKMLGTIMIGRGLRGVTRGLSMKAATGALTVQFRDITASFVPAQAAAVAGLGYMSPAAVYNAQGVRVSPNRTRLGAYVPGQTPLLSGGRVGAYVGPAGNALLSAASREGFMR